MYKNTISPYHGDRFPFLGDEFELLWPTAASLSVSSLLLERALKASMFFFFFVCLVSAFDEEGDLCNFIPFGVLLMSFSLLVGLFFEALLPGDVFDLSLPAIIVCMQITSVVSKTYQSL